MMQFILQNIVPELQESWLKFWWMQQKMASSLSTWFAACQTTCSKCFSSKAKVWTTEMATPYWRSSGTIVIYGSTQQHIFKDNHFSYTWDLSGLTMTSHMAFSLSLWCQTSHVFHHDVTAWLQTCFTMASHMAAYRYDVKRVSSYYSKSLSGVFCNRHTSQQLFLWNKQMHLKFSYVLYHTFYKLTTNFVYLVWNRILI